jgi:hypothetical protein
MDKAGQMQCFIDSQDPDVDLALCPISLDLNLLDVKVIQSDLFLTDQKIKEEHINETDEVYFAGLFAPFVGVKKNYPIVRHGKIAMIADERIPILKVGHTADVYLVDVMSFGGNSGSPVIVLSSNGNIASSNIYLMGTIQGYFQADSPVVVQTALSHGYATENEGVAFVVPAKKITDILNSPGLKYCAGLSFAQYLQQQKEDADAYDLDIATLKLPSPPPEYKWCQTAAYLSAKALATTLKRPLSEIPPTEVLERVPFLPWRTNVKSAVTLLPAGRLEPTDADKYLLYGMDDSYFYVLKLDDDDPRGSASTVPRLGYTATYIQ